jgi:hypothetical protein
MHWLRHMNYLLAYLSIYASIYLSIYLCIYPSIYLSIYLSMHLSIYSSIYLSIYSSIMHRLFAGRISCFLRSRTTCTVNSTRSAGTTQQNWTYLFSVTMRIHSYPPCPTDVLCICSLPCSMRLDSTLFICCDKMIIIWLWVDMYVIVYDRHVSTIYERWRTCGTLHQREG